MASWFSRTIATRARTILVLSGLAWVAAGWFGSGAVGALSAGGFEDPGSESSRAAIALQDAVHQQQANLIVLVTAPEGAHVDDPTVARVARDITRELAATPRTTVLGDYWNAPASVASGLRSTDGRKALILVSLGGDEDAMMATTRTLDDAVSGTVDGVRVETGGFGQANLDITDQAQRDMTVAESIAIPLTLALMIVVFGSVVSGLLPLLVGGLAITGTFAVLGGLAAVTDVSVFALNLTTGLGLGLGIDYSLLIVNRFREELARGKTSAAAIETTLGTAGRTVLFSAATVAVALATLMVFPLYFLRSFAYAGIAVVGIAAAGALITLPAVLVLLGPRVDRLRVRRVRDATASTGGGWSRWAAVVMRRPVLTALPVVVVLGLLGVPFAGVDFGLPDDRGIPAADSQARRVGEVLRADFASRDNTAVLVVLPRTDQADPALIPPVVGAYAAALSVLPDVARVDSVGGTYVQGRQIAAGRPDLLVGRATGLTVVLTVDAYSDRATAAVRAVRALPAPGERLVGGPSAALVDVRAAIGDRLPLAAGLIGFSTFVLLFLFTGSVVLPVKALAINALTIVGVIGVMVWVFQDGHVSGVLGFTPAPLSMAMLLLMFCVAFGLSMDYEVFLLGRITEAHDAGADTTTAVATGLERTGRIVTTAAALLAITLFAFVSSKVSFLQMFGLGAGLAIVLDATLVRGVLVPAVMRLMGRANWWAPAPLRRLHARIGVSDQDEAAPLRELAGGRIGLRGTGGDEKTGAGRR